MCDLVNASFSLPFTPAGEFVALWARIVDSIRPGGRFSGQLFGVHDEWAGSGLHVFTRAEVEQLLAPFEVERLEEVDEIGSTVTGSEQALAPVPHRRAQAVGSGACASRNVGSSALAVSVVGLGGNNFGWRLDEAQTRAVVDAAVGAGITLFDTAESYGDGESELFLGRALAGRRDRVVIATKFGWGGGRGDNSIARGSPAYVRTAIEGSLRRLGTDYVDLYQYHRPDGVTPIEETLGAMDELVREGKVRHIGSSNLSAAQVGEADRVAAERGLARFVSAQNEYSWLAREAERDLIPVCDRLEVGLLPYFPLARGLLTGKYRRGKPAPDGTRLAAQGLAVDDATWGRIEALEAFARDRGLRLLDVAIGGLAAQPGRLLGDRGRDDARAGARERGCRGVGALGRRARRATRAVASRRWRVPTTTCGSRWLSAGIVVAHCSGSRPARSANGSSPASIRVPARRSSSLPPAPERPASWRPRASVRRDC